MIEHIADPPACLTNSPESLEPAAMSFSHVRARFPLTGPAEVRRFARPAGLWDSGIFARVAGVVGAERS